MRALIERFGEQQAAPPGQPTVKDVAETLQLPPETVSAMLTEIRKSLDQDEINQRLDRLEQERSEPETVSDVDAPSGEKKMTEVVFVTLTLSALVFWVALTEGDSPIRWIIYTAAVAVPVLALLGYLIKRLKS